MSLPIFNRSSRLIHVDEVSLDAPSTKPALYSSVSNSVKGGSEFIPRKVAIQDCLFLIAIVLLSGLPYVAKLGFYADDWAFFGPRHAVKDHSLGALFHSLGPTVQSILGVRPGQTVYQVLTYFFFGLHPLPYHLIDTLALAGVAALFYVSLRELGLPRYVVLVVPLVYGLLPHYATDRFWFAAHQAVFSQALFFFGLYAALSATRCARAAAFWLNVVSVASFVLALLFYEVIVGLLPLVFLLIGYAIFKEYRSIGVAQLRSIGAAALYVFVSAVCIGATLGFKMRMTDRVVSPLQHPPSMHIGALLRETLNMTAKFNVLHYGIDLPRVAFQLYRFSMPDALSIITAVVISVAVVLYLNRAFRRSHFPLLGIDWALYLIASGFLIFVMDYAPFSILKSSFSYDGDNNRVVIAAAIGAAFVMAGGAVLLIGAIIPIRLQLKTLCATIAAICGLNFVCIACFANCWSKAYTEQEKIVSAVRKNLSLPPGSTVLLDGFCRYVGPAPVLQNSHDATGALQIAYNDDTLQADVVSPEMKVGDESIQSAAFGIEQKYVYNGRLWLYNVRRMTVLQLADSQVTRRYFQTFNPDMNSGCPMGWEGLGSPIR